MSVRARSSAANISSRTASGSAAATIPEGAAGGVPAVDDGVVDVPAGGDPGRLEDHRLWRDGLDRLGARADVVRARDPAGADEAGQLAGHDVGVQLGDGAGLLDRVGADAGEDADLARPGDRPGQLAHRHGVLGVVEERGPDAGRGERLGEDVPHPAARAQALHGLGAGNEVRAVPDDPGEVDELGGEQRLEAVPLAELVGLRREPTEVLAVQVRLGIDDEERPPENYLLHFVFLPQSCL